MSPTFSVLVPVYNAEDYLEACVQSVKDQSFQDFELILVDDGSKDSSGKLCDQLASEDDRIFSYHKENGGQLHTRLAAMEKAKGKYFVFLDADDTLVPSALESIWDAFRRTGCDCVFYELQRVRDGQIIQPVKEWPEETVTEKRELYRRCFFDNIYNSMCCRAVPAELCKKKDYSGWYHLRHGEDLLQSIDILRRCSKVTFLNRALYNYTYNPGSVTSTRDYSNYHVDFTLRQILLDFLKEENVFTEADYTEYRTACIMLMLREVKRISRFPSGSQKRALLEEIRQQDYYRNFLIAGSYDSGKLGKDDMLFSLLRKKQDGMLLMILKLWALLKG